MISSLLLRQRSPINTDYPVWKQAIESPRDALEISASSWMELGILKWFYGKTNLKNLVFFLSDFCSVTFTYWYISWHLMPSVTSLSAYMSVNGHSDWSILKWQRHKTNPHATREKPSPFQLGKYVKRLNIKSIFMEVFLLTPTKDGKKY